MVMHSLDGMKAKLGSPFMDDINTGAYTHPRQSTSFNFSLPCHDSRVSKEPPAIDSRIRQKYYEGQSQIGQNNQRANSSRTESKP
ncbi:Uncharacterized protein HZ326_27139 [Fusarium oxysporum f. sp. albedinis]|nr:Uncharacterized protein HZ326_27139 [Fusarium oxysporum f. sp. albedinis]